MQRTKIRAAKNNKGDGVLFSGQLSNYFWYKCCTGHLTQGWARLLLRKV